ncbi:putative arabinosyltransferase C [Corynebacterium felinum]|uniref:Arabinosyltransferase C n=1 Tax=Corynebacterium felinum TaxID=131318 RepID=A0ABU2B718_9CORY|nr:arabinosyltransferase C [Corynebacterium felinum]WJY93771.1 putative arabinosyltransferase C [Corynebacterium felinum]
MTDTPSPSSLNLDQMASAVTAVAQQAEAETFSPAPTWLKRLAAVSGVLGFVLFVLTPLMPVSQVQSSIAWPQNSSLSSVSAPLVSYAPERIDISVPVRAIEHLRTGENLLVGTLPPDSEQATSRGLFVRSTAGALDVVVRDDVFFQLSKEEVDQLPGSAVVKVTSTDSVTQVVIPGTGISAESEEEEDNRPQISGIYTEISESASAAALIDAGLKVDVEINSRYTSSPTPMKYATMLGGGLFMVLSLWALFRIDRLDGKGRFRFWPVGFFRPRPLDGVVAAVLGYWYVFGANTSDDGFILTMARASQTSDYMANYYRWFGVPESPFGAPYYDFLSLLTQVSTASTWMRLPSLIAGVLIWLVLSREVLPRLGAGIESRKAAQWTCALMFLAFWLPYNNGLRPEPIIALGTLVAWSCFERAIEHKRLAPAAVGGIVAAFTLACGPTGLMAVAALLVSISTLVRIMRLRLPSLGIDASSTRARIFGAWVVLLAPFAAAGTAVFVAVFGDQTLMTVLESIHVRGEKGPSLKWFQEWVRYEVLFQQTVDGSFARRFAVLFALVAVVLVFASMLRNGKVPGSNRGPALRLMMVFMGTLFFMSFTPTKWTHHFGVWAGIAAALGALGAIALSEFATRARHIRTLVVGGLLFVFAFSLSGTNGFWYVSSYGVPWWDKSIQVNAIEASSVMLVISLIVLVIGAVQSVRFGVASELPDAPKRVKQKATSLRFRQFFAAPIAGFCAIAVMFSMASMTKGFVSQYPAYSVGLGNIRSLQGHTCGLADDTLVETNTNDSFLSPVNTSLGDSLEKGEKLRGFEPNRVPALGTLQLPGLVSAAEEMNVNQGRRKGSEKGANGSQMRLPFNLDPMKVPVVGSYTEGTQYFAEAITDWYQLPKRSSSAPLIVVTAAGAIEHVDADGVKKEGRKLMIEYGKSQADGSVTVLGKTRMLDAAGMTKRWRNLRLPLDDLPAEADVVRIHATDASLDYRQWMAFTPPRVPTLDTLQSVIGSERPGLVDWAVPLQFPCQRPFGHYAGVAELPEYRISADTKGKLSGASFQDFNGGGATGTAEAVNQSYELPSYAVNDWQRDWGAIEMYSPRPNSIGEKPVMAKIDTEVITRSGLWNPGHQNIDTNEE